MFEKSIKISLVFLFALGLSFSGMAQGIEFFHGTWPEALQKAKEEGRMIFVDANTSWCGPCRRMAKNVFTQEKVGDFFNSRFINMKVDMEKGDIDFRKAFHVRAYPTLFFIDENGQVVKKKVGGQQAESLIKLGQEALALYDNIDDMNDLFEQGKRDAAFLRKYVKALNNAGKPTAKAVNIYLRRQKDLSTPENLLFIFDAVQSADSKAFDLLIEHRKDIEKIKSPKAVKDLIKRACKQTVKTAIEFQDENLLKEAKSKMKKHYPEMAKPFKYQADLSYFAATKNEAEYLKCAKKYAKKIVKKNAFEQHKLATDVYSAFPASPKATKLAEELAEKAAQTGGLWEYYFTYAQLLAKNNKKKEAIQTGEKALEIAQTQKAPIGRIRMFLSKLKAER